MQGIKQVILKLNEIGTDNAYFYCGKLMMGLGDF